MKYIFIWVFLCVVIGWIFLVFFFGSHISSPFNTKSVIPLPNSNFTWVRIVSSWGLDNIDEKYIEILTISSWAASTIDKFSLIANTNPLFLDATRLAENKDFTGSIALLQEARKTARWSWELAIIDFNISDNTFSLDRLEWTEDFIKLIQNTDYSPRIRALAMQRIYLKYIKFNDRKILYKLAEWLNIQSESRPEIRLKYMKKAYDLYPLPSSSLFLMQNEISAVDNKTDALTIFDKYITNINLGIQEMLNYPWELSETTSAMLSRAQAFGNLYRDYAISSREEVEKLYRDLIQFDQEKWLKINKQYALVYYANFLAEINEPNEAQKIIKILLEDWLESSLIESLPKTKDLTALRIMSPITDKMVQDFIDFLWPVIK